MTAQVIYLEHVLTPHKRQIVQIKPQTIRRLAPKWQRPYIALLNGEAILRAEWGKRIKHGDVLAFVDVNAIPQGGGGDGGSNPLQMVAMLAIMVVAPEVGLYFGLEGAALTATTMAVQMVGMALVNALIPPPKPPTPQVAASLAAASPTYNLQAQGNQARLESAIPEHFGRLVAYPDFAAQPYAEYSGNEQYLYQLLCIGRGEYDIEAVRLEDTSIASFDEINYEIIGPGGSLTLFPADVISSLEVSGQSPNCSAGTYARSGTTVTVTLTAHGLTTGKSVYLDFTTGTATDGTYSVVTAPTADTFTVTDTASGTTSGNVTVSPWLGGFIASSAGTSANYIGVDYVLSRGLYYANTDGSLANASITVTAEARTVDDSGAPTSSWAALGTPTYTAATSTPQRYSERYSVTSGRYEVRVRRVDIKQTDTRYGNEIAWAGMRAYLPETRTFGDVTLMAMRMKASNNLSMQGSRKINVIATRKLPILIQNTISATDKASTITVAGDVVTTTYNVAWSSARASSGISTGKWYWEIKIDSLGSSGTVMLGVGKSSAGLSTYVGGDANGWGYYAANGGKYNGGSYTAYGATYTAGDVIGFALDMGDGTLVFYKNGVSQGTAFTGLTGTLFPMISLEAGTGTVQVTANFGDAAFVYAIPTGFTYNTWSANTATRSIAWPIAYACKQMGLTDAQIDLATLLSLDATWASRGDYFDGRFDSFLSFWEVITKMAGAGRAKPYMQGGIVRIMRDQAASIPVALFSVRNIVKGSFSINYLMPTADTADAIDVGYFDKYIWAPRRVRAKLTGSTAAKPVKVEMFGVTERDQAFREGMYQAACNRYRRKHIKFSTEMEGFIPSFGDLIAIQHDMPAWGFGGEIIGWNAGTRTATLSENMTWAGGTNYIALRKQDGSVDGPYVVTQGASANLAVFVLTPAYTPYTGTDKEKTHFAFGNGNAYLLARMLTARTSGLNRIEIEAVNEDSNVHTAETGMIAPVRQVSQLASYTSAPEIVGLTGISMPGSPEKMLLSWQPSQWADRYLIEQSSDGVKWTRTGESTASNYTATALYGANTLIRVAAVGMARGPWVQITYGLLSDYMWNATDTTLMWNASSTTPMWRF